MKNNAADDKKFLQAIPDSVLGNHVGILGKTGSGKTSVAKLIAEYLLSRNERVCVIDPTDVWWGLQSDSTGKKAGFPVTVFGGRHENLPLLPNSGTVMADIVATSNTPAVLSLRAMKTRDRCRFFTDFAETLLEKNEKPLWLFIDECQNFMPQGRVMDPQSGMMLHAANKLVSEGRSAGIRVIIISQRPAKVHKDSLTQIESLITMKFLAPQDINAVRDWIGEYADAKGNDSRAVLNTLPELKPGEAWLWAPDLKILRRGLFPRIRTYDSSKAPTGKDSAVKLASVDIPAIQKRLSDLGVEAQANDPKVLQRRVIELEKENKALRDAPAAVYGISDQERDGIFRGGYEKGQKNAAIVACKLFEELMRPLISQIQKGLIEIEGIPDQVRKSYATDHKSLSEKSLAGALIEVKKFTESSGAKIKGIVNTIDNSTKNFAKAHDKTFKSTGANITGGERKILTVLANYPQGRTKKQIGLISGYAINGGGFNNYLGSLRSRGLIEGKEIISITSLGSATLGPVDPLPTGPELQQYWLKTLDKAQKLILAELIAAYPLSMSKAAIAAATGYEEKGGGFNNALGRLRTLQLIDTDSEGWMSATADFFPAKESGMSGGNFNPGDRVKVTGQHPWNGTEATLLAYGPYGPESFNWHGWRAEAEHGGEFYVQTHEIRKIGNVRPQQFNRQNRQHKKY